MRTPNYKEVCEKSGLINHPVSYQSSLSWGSQHENFLLHIHFWLDILEKSLRRWFRRNLSRKKSNSERCEKDETAGNPVSMLLSVLSFPHCYGISPFQLIGISNFLQDRRDPRALNCICPAPTSTDTELSRINLPRDVFFSSPQLNDFFFAVSSCLCIPPPLRMGSLAEVSRIAAWDGTPPSLPLYSYCLNISPVYPNEHIASFGLQVTFSSLNLP